MERFVFIGKLKYFTKEEKILNLILKLLNWTKKASQIFFHLLRMLGQQKI
jgi:hypothetical protein